MASIQIDRKVLRFEYNYENTISKLAHTDGWIVVCIWSKFLEGCEPKSIIIRRKTADRDLEIAGNLTVFENGIQILRKKFMQLMESRSTDIEIKLKDDERSVTNHGIGFFEFKGLVNISPYFEKPDNLRSSLLGLSSDFEQLLNPETSCIPPDVTLKCGNGSIPAHKFLLSARSPVFAAMFANPMRESFENEVVITDIDVSVLRAMVRYMYVGWSATLENIRVESACLLLVAADKYQVLPLKADCCNYLKNKISYKNVLLLLDHGDAIAKDLKSIAMHYIRQCPDFSTIQNSVEWKDLETKNPVLAMKVLSSLVKSRDKKNKRMRDIVLRFRDKRNRRTVR